nr:unnamed protein product [Digitaria exilis]
MEREGEGEGERDPAAGLPSAPNPSNPSSRPLPPSRSSRFLTIWYSEPVFLRPRSIAATTMLGVLPSAPPTLDDIANLLAPIVAKVDTLPLRVGMLESRLFGAGSSQSPFPYVSPPSTAPSSVLSATTAILTMSATPPATMGPAMTEFLMQLQQIKQRRSMEAVRMRLAHQVLAVVRLQAAARGFLARQRLQEMRQTIQGRETALTVLQQIVQPEEVSPKPAKKTPAHQMLAAPCDLFARRRFAAELLFVRMSSCL